jgi:IS605 OrfB family transposase
MILAYKIRLNPSEEQNKVLLKTLEQYKQAIDSPLTYGFQNKIVSGVELHKATYYPIQKQISLPSQLICSARCKATEILKSIKTKTKGKFSTKQPKSHQFPSIRYDRNSCAITKDFVKLSTEQGRLQVPVVKSEWTNKIDFKKIQRSCELQYKSSKQMWILTVFAETEEPKQTGGHEVIGIDRGCRHIAVCSDNTFFNSKQLRNVKGKYAYLRKHLQNKGTKSAKRLLKKLSGKEYRFVRDVNHCISKEIVNMPYDIIVMEKLSIKRKKEQGKRFNSILNGWSYKQLETFIDYKAKRAGKRVELVDARFTSQKCYKCGHIDRSNRYQTSFKCKACGFQLHADLNASRNIKNNFLATLGTSSSSRVQSITHTEQDLVLSSKPNDL